MSDRARRAGSYGRAGADPELEQLASQSGELAKRWAIALLERTEPEQLASVDVALIAREGPAVIEAVLAGAEGDAVAALAGAGGLVRAFEALRAVLWEAAIEAVPRSRSDPRAARRLLDVCDAVTAACAETLAGALEPVATAAPLSAPETPAPATARPRAPLARSVPAIVIVDERDGAEPAAGSNNAAVAPEAPAIAVHDARERQGPAAWISSIGAQLESFQRDSRPFAVLLIELLEPAGSAEERRPGLELVLDERLRDWRGLSATRERPGRHWLVAPATDRTGAEMLRERLEAALGAGRRSAAVAIGIAVCPEDASDAAGLAAQADLDIYASRTRSVPAPGWDA